MRSGRTLRDRPFRETWIVYVLGPFPADVVAALPAAFTRLVVRDALGVYGRSWPSRGLPQAAGERRRRAAAAIRHLDAADDTTLIRTALDLRGSGLPVGLVVATGRAALLVSHAVADGTEGVQALAALLAEAGGGTVAPVPRPTRLPVLRATVAAGRAAFDRYLARRRTAVPAGRALVEAVDAAPAVRADRGDFRRIVLGTADLAALRRRPGGRGGRATASTRVASLALEAMAAVHTGDGDPRVILPIDLRHLVGGRVAGNFIASEASGTLHAGDWRPGPLTAMLAEQREIGLPLLAVSITRPLRTLPRRRSAPHREVLLSVSMQSIAQLPAPASAATVGVAAIGLWPSTTTVCVLLAAGGASISIWDDSGRFDLNRVEQELRSRIAPVAATESA